MNKNNYQKHVQNTEKKSNLAFNMLMAFIFGGLLCVFAQGLGDLYSYFKVSSDIIKPLVSVSLIFLSCLFTGIGVYDRVARLAGAGLIVPITGFANSVISPAMDYKNEGLVLGLGAKMFIVAGPVIIYGTLLSVLYGIIYYFTTL